MSKIKSFFYIFLPIIIGSIVSFIINKRIDYEFLIRPFLAPPKILFPIFWTIIYLLMGLSYYLYKKNGSYSKKLDLIYYGQLIVNAFWSIIFFVWKLRLLASFWIVFLLILVIILIYLYWKNYKPSAYLNIFYMLWCTFATYLTIGIYILNH